MLRACRVGFRACRVGFRASGLLVLRLQHSQVSDVEKGFGVGPRGKQGLHKDVPESSRPFLAVRCTQRNTTLSTAFGARNPTTWVRGPLGLRV